MICYPSARLYEEVAFLSAYLHWTYDHVMALDHLERQRWVEVVSQMNSRMGAANDFP